MTDGSMNIEKSTLFQGAGRSAAEQSRRAAAAAANGFWVLPPFWRVRVGDRVSGVGKLSVGHNNNALGWHATIRGHDGVKPLLLMPPKAKNVIALNIIP